MPIFEIQTPEGKILEIEAGDEATAIRGAQEWSANQSGGAPAAPAPAPSKGFVPPPPPPGEIIHGTSGSYVTGQPGLSVDTKGMSQEDRDMASAALAGRRDAPTTRGLMPVMQGASMSYGDEAVSGLYAGAAALEGGDPAQAYKYAQEVQRQELEQERTEHPYRSTAGQIGGALLWAPRAMAAGATMMAGAPLATRTAAGFGSAATYGAVEGFGAGDSLKDRATGAGVGAVVGGTVGLAAPAIGAAAKNGLNKFLNWRDVSQRLRELGIDRPAGDIAMRVLDGDDAFGPTGAARLTAAGPGAMLADVGEGSRSLLDNSIQRAGTAGRIARGAVEGRAADANTRLTGVLDSILGRPEGIATRTQNVREGTRAARSTAYDEAYAQPIDYSTPEAMRLEQLLARVPQKAITEANEFMGLTGHQSRQILADISDDGSVTYRTMPDVLQIDHITRGLRQMAQSSEGTGALGAQTAKGAAYEQLAGELRGLTRNLVPQYGRALDTAADPIQEIGALKFGRDLLKPSLARDEVRMRVNNMTAAELRGARQGLRSQIDETVANVQAAATDPNIDARQAAVALRDLSSPAAREKVRVILGNDTASAVLFRELDQASRALELRAGVANNSRTFARNAMDEGVKAAQEPGPIGNLKRGKPFGATQAATQRFFGTTPGDDIAARDEIYRQISQLLTQPRGPETQEALAQLYQAYRALPQNAETARRVGSAAISGLVLGGVPEAADVGRNLLGLPRNAARLR